MSSLQIQNGADRDRVADVFHKRALALARRKRGNGRLSAQMRLVVFRQGTDRFGIELAHVEQIFQRVPITPVPGSAAYVVGIANLNGTLRSVIGLGPLLKLKYAGDVDSVILLRTDKKKVGIGAHAIENLCQIDADTLTSVDDIASPASSTFTRGMTEDHVIVLDAAQLIEHLLDDSRTDVSPSNRAHDQTTIEAT